MAGLVAIALRCYPARWRQRHGDEAAELAALLIRDGTPAGSVAWSYLAGAAREWLTPRLDRRFSAAAVAVLVVLCSLGASAGLVASAGPARAAGPSQARGPAHCRPLAATPGVGPATGRPPVFRWEAGHDRTC